MSLYGFIILMTLMVGSFVALIMFIKSQ